MTALAAWRNRLAGKRAVVAGCGPSVHDITLPMEVTVFGVHDVGRWITPDHLVLVDSPQGKKPGQAGPFTDKRLATIINTLSPNVWVSNANVKHWRKLIPHAHEFLYVATGVDQPVPPWRDRDWQIHRIGGSPLTALSLAAFMGCTRIGIIGVDLSTHRKFSEPDELEKENACWRHLCGWLAGNGVEVVNLSSVSALTAIPSVPLDRWLE